MPLNHMKNLHQKKCKEDIDYYTNLAGRNKELAHYYKSEEKRYTKRSKECNCIGVTVVEIKEK